MYRREKGREEGTGREEEGKGELQVAQAGGQLENKYKAFKRMV